MTSTYQHPADPNLNNLLKSMEYAINGDPSVRTVVMNDITQPIPVSLNGNDVVITGNVTIPGIVNVYSTTSDPVHVHVSEIGTSGILTVPWMPIAGNVYVDGGNINVRVTSGNVNVANQATDLVIADSTYEINVVRGLLLGQYVESKNGLATGVSQNVSTTIWLGPTALYPWDSWTVAQPLYVISDSVSDTAQTIRIHGLDSNYDVIDEDIVTNGITAVPTVNNFIRINRCSIISGNTNAGTITQRIVSGTGTVVGSMSPGYSRNKGGFITVPRGYTAYLTSLNATQFRSGSGNIGGVVNFYTRSPGAPFTLQVAAEVVNGQYSQVFDLPLAFVEKTDIDVRIVADGNSTTASCYFQLIHIAN